MEHLSFFEHVISTDQTARDENRKAVVVALKRAKSSFGPFLAAARDEEEYKARFDLIEDDFKATVASAVEEHGGDPARVEATLRREFTFRKEAPGNQHLPGASDKRNRQYEHIKESCLDEGKSEEECKELAARTVNKQRAEHGETKSHRTAKTAVGLGGPGRLSPMHPGNAVQGEVPNERSWGEDYVGRPEADAPGICGRCGADGAVPGAPCPECGYTGGSQEDPAFGGLTPDGQGYADVPPLDTPGLPGFRSHRQANPEVINLEPNWENMRQWVLNVAKTDPETALDIAQSMGREGPSPEELQAALGPDYGGRPEEEIPYHGSPGNAGTGYSKVARRPKMCPYHSEVTDISLTAGDPLAGYQAMSSHAWGPQHCQGNEYEGRCNFKREMVTQEYWDKRAEQAEERRQERERAREIEQQVQETEIPENLEGIDETPPAEEPSFADDGSSAIGEGVESEPVQTEEIAPVAAKTSEAVETVDVQKGKAGDPSPKMDKTKFNPEEGRGKPIDTEGEGSPHPTQRIDPLDPSLNAKRNDGPDFLEGTKAVTEKQDVTKSVGPQRGGEGGTWSQNNGASPVSSVQDVHKNPIREILQSQFVPQNTIEEQLQEWE